MEALRFTRECGNSTSVGVWTLAGSHSGGYAASTEALTAKLCTTWTSSKHTRLQIVLLTMAANLKVQPKSSHVSDLTLQPFIQASFDPADYLNSTLPALSVNNLPRDQGDRVPLAELSTRTQTLLSSLKAQTSRLSGTLTQLTDEILRSGSRLAYEVEVLRGEAVGLSETLNDTLKGDIAKFAAKDTDSTGDAADGARPANASEPEYITQLRTLTLVRSRLDSVIKVFGDAMEWPLAPSELSVTSSLISVSAPTVGPEESRNREEKGKEAVQKLQNEISAIFEGASSAEEGVAAAIQKIEELRGLSSVWKGTAEEKARNRLIENLSKTVEEEQKKIAKRSEGRRQGALPAQPIDYRYGSSADSARAVNEGGYGFIKNLQKFKGEIYLD